MSDTVKFTGRDLQKADLGLCDHMGEVNGKTAFTGRAEMLSLVVADLIAAERERCITVMMEQLQPIPQLFDEKPGNRRKALFANKILKEAADFMRTGE